VCHPEAEEAFIVSNVSVNRTVDVDWTCAGGKITVGRYQPNVSDGDIIVTTNVCLLAGRTRDGGIILDVILNKARLSRLEAAVQELINSGV